MFVLSQYLLNTSGMCKTQQILSYSIALGLILYSSIYIYLLFYNEEYLSIFNKFIIYIVVVDLLLAAFYFFNLQDAHHTPKLKVKGGKKSKVHEDEDTDEDTDEEVEYVSSDEDEDEDENLDDESQKYIDSLIAQARFSDQQRMLDAMNKEEGISEKDEDEDEEQKDEKDEKDEKEKSVASEQKEDDISQEIQHIINDVVTTKKPAKRAPKKKSQQASLE